MRYLRKMQQIDEPSQIIVLSYISAFLYQYKFSAMSYSRNIEPQLLSIQAIVQKSQFKNKVLNSIPLDIKKLFMEEMSKAAQRKLRAKRGLTSTEEVCSHMYQRNDSNFSREFTYFGISKNPRSFSMTSTQYNKNLQAIQSLQTTRTISKESQLKKRNKKQRHSVEQIGKIQQVKQFNIEESETKNIENLQAKSKTTYPTQGSQNRYKRIQFELIMPTKQTKYQGLRKIYNQSEKPTHSISPQKPKERQHMISKTQSQDNTRIPQKILTNNIQEANERISKPSSLRKKKFHTEQQLIPDFVMAAVGLQNKKISPMKPYKMEVGKIFEEVDDENKNDHQREQRSRSNKLPVCVMQMKKKVSFYRVRKSQESCEDVLEPKAQFMRLIEKQKGDPNRKQSQIIKRDKSKIFSKISAFKGVKRKAKIQVQEQLKGWEIKDNPQFYDYN